MIFVTYLLSMASKGYQCCFEKGKSQLGSENSYHISILFTFFPSLKISKSVYEPLAFFGHPSRCQKHKGVKVPFSTLSTLEKAIDAISSTQIQRRVQEYYTVCTVKHACRLSHLKLVSRISTPKAKAESWVISAVRFLTRYSNGKHFSDEGDYTRLRYVCKSELRVFTTYSYTTCSPRGMSMSDPFYTYYMIGRGYC